MKKYTKKDIIKRVYKLHMSHNDCKIITDCILEIFEEMFTKIKIQLISNLEILEF